MGERGRERERDSPSSSSPTYTYKKKTQSIDRDTPHTQRREKKTCLKEGKRRGEKGKEGLVGASQRF